MLFHVTWKPVNPSEEADKRTQALFAAWTPPEGVDFKAFYDFADQSGGLAIVEVPDAVALARTVAPWTVWLEFDARPIIPAEENVALFAEAIAFRDSVG